MSDERDLPRTSAEARELMNRIAFDPPMTPEEEAELLATLPPTGSVVMVVRSLRLPMEMTRRGQGATSGLLDATELSRRPGGT